MSLIALDASTSQASLALLDDEGQPEGRWALPLRPGLIETLPVLLRESTSGRTITDIAVCTGPGSFTGLRTSIALAQGFAAGLGIQLWGIPAWDAYSESLADLNRPLWVVVRARRGRFFLLQNSGSTEAFADEDLPLPQRPIAIAGEEAELAVILLSSRGADVTVASTHPPDALCVGLAALRHKRNGTPPSPALPLYVDPPEAKRPASGLRPPPL